MKKKLLYEAPQLETTVIQFEKHLMEGSIEGLLESYAADPLIVGEEVWL